MSTTCRSYEGCRGLGWLYDLTDSGSGATVYCECEAGERLLAEDLAARDLERFRVVREQKTDDFEERYGRTDGAT